MLADTRISMRRGGWAWLAVLLPVCLAAGVEAAPKGGKAKSGAASPAGKAKGRSAEGKTDVKLVRVPERGIQPQVQVDGEGRLHLVFLGDDPGSANVYYTHKSAGAPDETQSFSKALRVNSQPGSAIAIGSIRGAQMAIGSGNRVHVAWNGSNKAEPKGAVKYGNPMLYSRLADGGERFEPQRNVIEKAYNLDGGGSVAADLEGNVYVVWHGGDGTGEANRRIWVVHSSDEGRTFAPESAADAMRQGVCGCCGLKAFADREGEIFILYRGARENVNRDMLLLTSTDHGSSFSSVLADKCTIATCPMSSESFVDGPQAVTAAWETNDQVYFARYDKQGAKLSKATPAPGEPAKRKHPALATNGKGETILVWTEGTGWERGGGLAWQVFDERGKPTRARGRSDGIPVWSFAAVYAAPDDSFVILY